MGIIDHKGERHGIITVLEPTEKRSGSGAVIWKCKCDCGKELEVPSNRLKIIKSCGCERIKKLIEQNHKRALDLTNQKFGKLTALYPNGTDNNRSIIWHCKCECGNECDVSSHDLIQNHTTSCGCNIINNLKDKRFGKLIVKKDSGLRDPNNGAIIWECQCDCGNTINVLSKFLLNGTTTHCGCERKISKGQEKIAEILKENNIFYSIEKTFFNCRFPDTNRLAKFDFYINNKYIIEFDGIQHFKVGGWATEEKVKYTQEHDKFKNQYCKEHNIPIIRIPYSHLEQLCLEDLLLETSQFIVG